MDRTANPHRYLLVAIIALISAYDAIAGDLAEDAKLSVDIQLSTTEMSACGKVSARIAILNEGQFPVSLPATLANPHYWTKLVITGPDGKELDYIGPEIQLVGVDDTIRLFPGMYYGMSLEVSCDNYDLSKPGEYTIVVSFGKGPTRTRDLDLMVRSPQMAFFVTENGEQR